MILPIYAYGTRVLKKESEEIDPSYDNLKGLIADMWETMYNARGVGLAAPQVGKSIRLFMVDTDQLDEEKAGIKSVFINPEIIESDEELWTYEEGCLSIPEIRGDVERPKSVRIKYLDEDFVEHVEVFDGMEARVVQHEYDHLEGLLFTEFFKPVKRRRVKRKLEQIRKGIADVDYPMRFV